MWNHRDKPYQELPTAPDTATLETPAVLKATVSATRELARLDGICRLLPDPAILINIIPIMEAQASSEIENVVTTNDELFKAASGATTNIDAAAKEALRYRTALRVGYDSLAEKPITTNTAINICSHIIGKPAIIRNTPGTYIGNPSTKNPIYTPPVGEKIIRNHLDAWEKLLHTRKDLDPLVAMTVAHYQFEAIHPFFDGNGRTGRIINILYLIESGLLKLPILYLSGHIVRTKLRYYELLNAVTTHDQWEPWILYMLNGIETTAQWTTQLIENIHDMQQSFEQKIRTVLPKMAAPDLGQLIFKQPYIRIENIVESGLAQRQTASRWLNTLVEKKILDVEKVGRSLIFINRELLALLFDTPLPNKTAVS